MSKPMSGYNPNPVAFQLPSSYLLP
jgi:hypothetical protein